VSHFPENCPIF
jgi:uncharacterized protein YjbI with pentapeptide repeats